MTDEAGKRGFYPYLTTGRYAAMPTHTRAALGHLVQAAFKQLIRQDKEINEIRAITGCSVERAKRLHKRIARVQYPARPYEEWRLRKLLGWGSVPVRVRVLMQKAMGKSYAAK